MSDRNPDSLPQTAFAACRLRGTAAAFRVCLKCVLSLVGLAWGAQAFAQGFVPDGQHFPLSQRLPPGTVAQWMVGAGRVVPGYFQPVQFIFPSAGQAAVYAGPDLEAVVLAEDSKIALSVGHVYRLKLSGMPEYPGVELYPSVEVVDHLHPPAGRYGEFPVRIEFTREELEAAMDGGLVTRVVYLEQPQVARPIPQTEPMPVLTVNGSVNVLEAADRQGRPMVIVRLGSRMPPAVGGDRTFFGSGAPIAPIPEKATVTPPEIEQAIVRTPPEPRLSPAVVPRALSVPPPVHPPLAEVFPDEYLFDGGDRALPIHYTPMGTGGFDTEDTFAQFYDHRGRRHTQPTNRVAVYAPRFGAVRTVSLVATNVDVKHIADAKKARYTDNARNRVLASHFKQRSTGEGLRMRSRASGVESHTRRLIAMRALRPAQHEKLINLYESYAFLRTGQIEQLDVANIAAAIEAAGAWTRDQYPVIGAHLASAGELYSSFKAEQFVGTEFQGEDGRLRIVKLADRKSAAPGDVITFAIRFDNLGDRPLERVKIVDNLTPRLEYIEDSATSNREGNVTIESNGEGSSVLTFDLDQPLPGKTGGVVEFQVRVR